MYQYSSFLVCLGLAGTLSVYALESDSIVKSEFRLPSVDVVADSPEQQTAAYRLIYSLSEQEIKRLPAVNVNEILAYLPGVDVRTRSANGVQADVNMRGGTFDQVMILLNGVNISDPQTGHYAMNIPVNPDIIERIEILQGAAVDLFGTNAFSGAINIVTRPSQPLTADSLSAHRYGARLSGGRWGLWNAALNGQWLRQHQWHALSGEYAQSTGYIANTDYKMANLYYGMGYKGLELQIGAQYKDAGANSFYSLASQDQFDATRTAFLSARYAQQWGAWGIDMAAVYRANYDRYEWHWGTVTNKHLSQTAALSAKTAYAFAFGKTTLGVELRNENILSTGLGDSLATPQGPFALGKNRLNINYFVQQAFFHDWFSAGLGFQGNWNTLNGHNFAGGVNLSAAFAEHGKIFVNANRSLRMPTFTDLYYHAGIQRGNLHLKSEKAWNMDLGIQYAIQGFGIKASAYYRLGQDIIDWQLQADGLYYAQNIPRLDAAGSELILSYHYGEWLKKIEVAYTYAHSFLQDVDLAKSMYLDYLSHKLVIRLDHRIYKGFGASWTLSYQVREGFYTDSAGQAQAYRPVWLWDGSVYWANKKVHIALDCTNILNQKYYCYGGIIQPGAWPRGTIKVML